MIRKACHRWALALFMCLSVTGVGSALGEEILIVPRLPIDRKFPANDWCQVQNIYYVTAPSCSLFVNFDVKLTGAGGASFGAIGLDDVLVTRNLLQDPTCTECPYTTDANGNNPIHNWCYTSNGSSVLEEDFSSGWQDRGWILGPGASVGPLNGSNSLRFASAPGVFAAPCDTARARLVLTGLEPGYQHMVTLWWSVQFPQPGSPVLAVSFSRPAACGGPGNCGTGNCFVWPNVPSACAVPMPANMQVGLVSNGSRWNARASWRNASSPLVTEYRVYRSATEHLGAAVPTAARYLGATSDTAWIDTAFSLGETNYYVIAANGQGGSSPAAEAKVTIPGGETLADANTTLLLHFNGTTGGAAGETPSLASGIAFEPGVFGDGALLSGSSHLEYPGAGNITPSIGTFDFWIKPLWAGNDDTDHYVLRHGEAGGILIGKDAGNFWRSIFNRFGEAGPEIGTGHFITSEWVPQQWHHSAFTWSPSLVTLYIDGQFVASAIPGTAPPAVADPSFQLGGDGSAASLDAVLDEVRLSDRVRSPQEILDCYARGLAVGISAPPAESVPMAFRSIVPNPVTGTTRIAYFLAVETRVEITVFDIAGRNLGRIYSGVGTAGEHGLQWTPVDRQGRSLGAGIYLLRLQCGDRSVSRRIAVM